MSTKRRGSMLYGALLLTLGAVSIRLVQTAFQIYISGVMGAAGLGRMQLILTIGSFGAVLASGGVRIAATCLAAEEAGFGRESGVRTAVRCCCLYGLLLSVGVALILYVMAEPLAEIWVGDPSALGPLRVLAVFLPANCISAVFSGYYTASGRITELVAVELLERIAAVGLVILLLRAGPEDPCMAVFLGSSLATLGSLCYLLFRYYAIIRRVPPEPMGGMMKRLLTLTLPLGMNDVLRSGLSTLENVLVPKGLQKSGSSPTQAVASYGVICGMVFPVITFPSVILYSLSDLLVPEMARSRALERSGRIRFLSRTCLEMTVLFATGVACLCCLLGDTLGQVFFQSREAGMNIRIYAPLILILYCDAITDGILKGLSQQIHSVRYNTITSFLDVLLIVLLLPKFGIGGFLAAFTLSHCLNFFLSFRRLILVTGYQPRFRVTILSAICGITGILVLRLWPSLQGIPELLSKGGIFLLLYGILILLTGALSAENARWLLRLIRRSHLEPGQSAPASGS